MGGQMARVLVLDDQECLLEIISVYLASSGHSILRCSSSESAIRQFKDVNGAIDLLVADVTLGDSSGVYVGLEFMASTPKLKLLFISGYPLIWWKTGDVVSFHKLPSDSVRVLQKPFSPLDLLLKVDELVGQLPQAVTISAAAQSA